MESISYEKILELLDEIDKKDNFDVDELDVKSSADEVESKLGPILKYEVKTILGFDIYEYSKKEDKEQALIPFIFDMIFTEAKKTVLMDTLLFDENPFNDQFIQTGDGGFQVFKNPLQALVFNSTFHVHLKMYNSNGMYSKLRNFVGPIYLRSCITLDNLFNYKDNFYGPAIINNARILSKDKLNRFLIDENTNNWFLRKMNGIENITEIDVNKIIPILNLTKPDFKSVYFYQKKIDQIRSVNRKQNNFNTCHIQKIGRIKAKEDVISVYNIEIQLYTYLMDEKDATIGNGFITTIGNSNSTGINE